MALRRLLVQVVVVRDLDAATERYQMLGFALRNRSGRQDWGCEASLFEVGNGGGYVELISPVDASKRVASEMVDFLDSRGEGHYLLCVEVDDVHAEYERLHGAGLRVTPPRRAPTIDGWDADLIWVAPQDTGGAFLEYMSFR